MKKFIVLFTLFNFLMVQVLYSLDNRFSPYFNINNHTMTAHYKNQHADLMKFVKEFRTIVNSAQGYEQKNEKLIKILKQMRDEMGVDNFNLTISSMLLLVNLDGQEFNNYLQQQNDDLFTYSNVKDLPDSQLTAKELVIKNKFNTMVTQKVKNYYFADAVPKIKKMKNGDFILAVFNIIDTKINDDNNHKLLKPGQYESIYTNKTSSDSDDIFGKVMFTLFCAVCGIVIFFVGSVLTIFVLNNTAAVCDTPKLLKELYIKSLLIFGAGVIFGPGVFGTLIAGIWTDWFSHS